MSTVTSCPICTKSIAVDQSDAHVNACIEASESNNGDEQQTTDDDQLLAWTLQAEEEQHQQQQSLSVTRNCSLCHKGIADDLFILDECSHKAHRACVADWVRTQLAVELSLKCPVEGCGKALSVRDTKELSGSNNNEEKGAAAQHKRARHDASQRLMKELELIAASDPKANGFEVECVDDDLYRWQIKLFGFDAETPLAADLAKTKDKCLLLHAVFPVSYPFAPPFVRVIRPRLAFRTGFVTVGGSICFEGITNSGWSPVNSMEAMLVSIRANLIEGGARLAPGKHPDYTVEEARQAFARMEREHGW